MRYIIITSFACILLFSSCLKRYDIKPNNGNIYTYQATISSSDYTNDEAKCFLSLDGLVFSPREVDESSRLSDEVNKAANPSRTDFCYKDGTLTSPGSDYANTSFTYKYNWEDISKWSTRIYTDIQKIEVSPSQLDTITDGYRLYIYGNKAKGSTVDLSVGSCYAFKNARYLGVFWVVSMDTYTATLKFRYLSN